MDYSKIKTNFRLEDYQGSDLLQNDLFESFKYQAFELIEALDWDGIVQFASNLEDKLKVIRPVDKEQLYRNKVLIFWYFRLKMFAFGALKTQDKIDLLQAHLLDMLRCGLEIKNPVIRYLDLFDTDSIVLSETQNLAGAVSRNQQVLGANVKSGKVKPTVNWWLQEYQVTVNESKKGVKLKPGSFEVLKFLDTNQFVKQLSKEEKTILTYILNFYNWLLDPITYVNNPPNQTLEGRVSEQKTSALIKPPIQKPAAKPLPKTLKPVIPVQFAKVKSAPPPVISPKPVQTPNASSKPSAVVPMQVPKTLGATGGVNVQKVLYTEDSNKPSGIKFQGEEKQQAKIPAVKTDMDKKLADLKGRVGYPTKPEQKQPSIEDKLEALKKKMGK